MHLSSRLLLPQRPFSRSPFTWRIACWFKFFFFFFSKSRENNCLVFSLAFTKIPQNIYFILYIYICVIFAFKLQASPSSETLFSFSLHMENRLLILFSLHTQSISHRALSLESFSPARQSSVFRNPWNPQIKEFAPIKYQNSSF